MTAARGAKRRSSGKRASATRSRALWVLFPLVLLVPVALDPLGKDVFRLPKLALAEILGAASLVVLVAGLWKSPGAIAWNELWRRHEVRLPGLVAIAASLSLLTSRSPVYSVEAWSSLLLGLVCWSAWSVGLESRDLRLLVRMLIVPGVLLSVVAILQFHDIWNPFEFSTLESSRRVELTSLAGASGDLASFLVLPFLLLQGMAVEKARRSGIVVPALAIVAYALLLAQNFTALGAALVASGMLWSGRLRRRRVLLWVSGLAVAFLAVGVLLAPMRSRLERVGDALSAGELNEALSGRLDAWTAAIDMWREQPVLGVGHGVFRAEFGRTKIRLSEEGDAFFRRHVYSNFATTHNDYLQALAEWGGVGFVLLLSGVFLYLRRLWLATGGSDRDAKDLAMARSLVVALAILSLAYFPWHLALIAYPGLLILAWGHALTRGESPATS